MLGEPETAMEIAQKVVALVGTKPTPGDCWRTATAAEALLLAGDTSQAARLYQEAVDMAPLAVDDHRSTRNQARELIRTLAPAETGRAAVEAVFAHLGD